MKVKLIYFRLSGKYYSDGEYDSKEETMFDVWEEVREMKRAGTLPGLVEGAREFIILVEIPDFDLPRLIL